MGKSFKYDAVNLGTGKKVEMQYPPAPWIGIVFDNEKFAHAIHMKAFEQRLSYRDVAAQAGVSPSTITRITSQRKGPDADTMARMIDWLNADFKNFIINLSTDGK